MTIHLTRTHVNPIKRNGPYSSASASTTRFKRLLEALLVWFVSCWKVDVFELNSGRLLLKSPISVLTYYLSPPKFPTAFSWRTKNLQICLSRICRSWHKMTYNLMNKFTAVYRTVITLRHIRRIMAVVVFFSLNYGHLWAFGMYWQKNLAHERRPMIGLSRIYWTPLNGLLYNLNGPYPVTAAPGLLAYTTTAF